MVAKYRPGFKAKLKKRIKLNNGIVLKAGTISDILIEKDDGKYHFEAENTACIVDRSEITIL